MSETLKKTVDRLPQLMQKNARSMMRRMLAAMNEELARGKADADAAYCALLLKTGEADLVNAFEAALGSAMAALATPGGAAQSTRNLPLTLELDDGLPSSGEDDFASSSALFKTLRANAKKLRIGGIGAFGKDVFLTALKEALMRSRISVTDIGKLMPCARRALNRELLSLYDKLNALASANPP